MNIIRKIFLGLDAIKGFLYKWGVDMHMIRVHSLSGPSAEDVIVSLTSYGRRVKNNVVYYTIISLLRQKRQPSRIILWLAEDEWNDNNIPKKLYGLKDNGVEICYCNDIKSYKKLIPTLSNYPNSVIITFDDDMIYSRDAVKVLFDEHLKHPHDIICRAARKPIILNGLPQKYSEWEDSILKPFVNGTSGELLFPVGVGGVLYPCGALHSDVLNKDLYMKFCPHADDIWFWFCGLRNHTIKRYVLGQKKDHSFDSIYQYLHNGSALTHSNNSQHQNDEQLVSLFKFFDSVI